MSATRLPLSALYGKDETAWLDAMAALAADERTAEMDFVNLSEFLSDMANRDFREVTNRLETLLMHLLKWEHQPLGKGRVLERHYHGAAAEIAATLGERHIEKLRHQGLRRCVRGGPGTGECRDGIGD